MRHAAVSAFILCGLAMGLTASTATVARAEYYCSPGFEPRYNGQCVATMARDEIQLYLNEPVYDEAAPIVRHRHHRHHRTGLRERY